MTTLRQDQSRPADAGRDEHDTDARDDRRASRSEGTASKSITAEEIEDIEQRSSPRTPVIYEIVRRLGEEEMTRPVVSLWWSGLAAGLSMCFSVLAQAVLEAHLPDTGWRPLVGSLGYTVGFVMAVLSRQQLFTETTITVVLPVMAEPTRQNFHRLAQMWSIVLVANLAGTFLGALFFSASPALGPQLHAGMIEISRHVLDNTWLEAFFRAIAAGFVMAAMVWLLPSAGETQFNVVVLMTYLIAAAGFAHVVAGSVEAFLLIFENMLTVGDFLIRIFLPVLIGNIVGGTLLFALLAYAQVMHELD